MLLIAFLVVGPKDLPRVARWLGRAVKKMRGLIREVKEETGWNDIEKDLKEAKDEVGGTLTGLKKDLDVTRELKGASAELNENVKSVQEELSQAQKAGEAVTGKK